MKHISLNIITRACILFCLGGIHLFAQEPHLQPTWWFGGGLGANFNFYSGDIKNPTPTLTTLASFTKGNGRGIFAAPLLEYRPDPLWGGLLQLGFDSRSGAFDDVSSADSTASLEATLNYISLEPSVRFTPTRPGLYFFAGPRLGFNVAKSFTYGKTGLPSQSGDFSGVRGTVLGAQIGAGYDIALSNPDAQTQIELSPFAAVHFGQGPRSEESWTLTTLRAGVNIKFGSTSEVKKMLEREVQFSVRAPKIIPIERKVKETFPLRNYVFFDAGSSRIPERYVQLTNDQAKGFKEESLFQPEPKDLPGRSARQLRVYRNVLNIVGDRMRRNSQARITLTGSAPNDASTGRAMATEIKNYLVNVFGIEETRITVEGREKPEIPSLQPGGTRELDLVTAEDRRVTISSNVLDVLAPVQIVSLQEDPLDSDVLVNVPGAQNVLASWTLEVIDENGSTKRFGPYTSERERISGKEILGGHMQGRYTMVLRGETKAGQTVQKEETIRLVRSDQPEEELGFRFSILFEFDQSKTVATYEKFLTETVAPMVPNGGNVIIHGHTDIVGEESHNLKLSRERAQQTMDVLERALKRLGIRNVKYDTYGFGEDIRRAPFDNRLPEERFYNRTVIIDIVPE
jgi:outer membrane protein OmpA-like peptidoglycan-associated protein